MKLDKFTKINKKIWKINCKSKLNNSHFIDKQMKKTLNKSKRKSKKVKKHYQLWKIKKKRKDLNTKFAKNL